MKKIISRSGFGALVIALLMSSCVSKKKYVQAQQTIEKYRMDSAQMAQNAAGLQQNISSLEEKNRGIQTQLDSSKAATQAEIQRWSGLQGYYDEEKSNITNIHQQLHNALSGSEVINAEEITASNGRVYVTLDEQVFSGGQLSTKGKKAIADFAGVLKDKQDLVVDVASGNSYAAYWSNSSTPMGNTDASTTSPATSADSSTTTSNSETAAVNDKTANESAAATSNASSSRPTARTNTSTHKSTAKAHRSSTATRSSRAASSKSSSSKSTAKKSESGRKMTFKSGSTKSSNSWNSNMAKATAIAKELHKNGIYNVGLMVPGSPNATDAGTGTEKKNFQLIVSPKTHRYYQMMESNSTSTSGVQK